MREPARYRAIERIYRTLDVLDLALELERLSFAIRERTRRTDDERRDLAQAAAEALTEASARLKPQSHMPGQPENAVRSTGNAVSAVYGAWHAALRQAERGRVARRAAWWVLREASEAWMRAPASEGAGAPMRISVACESDEGLAAVLAQLDAFPPRSE